MKTPRAFRLVPVLAALAFAAGSGINRAWAQDLEAARSDFRGDDGTPLPPADQGSDNSFRSRLENVGYGPLHLSSQSPFQSLRLAPPLAVPSSLTRGRWEVRETTAWSKMWGLSGDYLIDFEIVSTTHSVLYGVTDSLQVELGVVEATRFGGSLDGFVRGFHNAFGIQQDGRDKFPVGAYHFELKARNGSTIVVPEDRTNSSTEYLNFSAHLTLTEGSEFLPAVSFSMSVKGDLRGSSDLSGSGVEAGAALSFAKRLGDFYAYLSVGMNRFGEESFRGLDMRSTGTSILAALEWPVMEDVSLVLQQLRTQGALKNYGNLSAPSTEISLGIKIEARSGLVFEMGLIENIIVFDNSPDFGLHFGLSIRF